MNAIKTALLKTTADLDKAIDSIVRRGSKLQDEIQVVGLSLLAHIDQHSNPTQLNRLLVQLPKGLRRNALAEWAAAHGKLSINQGDDKKDKPLVFDAKKSTNLVKAESMHWTTFQPEKDIDQVFDFGKMLAALLNKAGKAKNLEGGELLAKVQAAMNA